MLQALDKADSCSLFQNEREDASRRSLETSQRLTARLRAAQSRADWNHARLQQAQTQMQDCVSLKVCVPPDAMLLLWNAIKQSLPRKAHHRVNVQRTAQIINADYGVQTAGRLLHSVVNSTT